MSRLRLFEKNTPQRRIIMKVSENVIHRCVADEDMLVPIGEAAMDMNGLYVLTPTGAEIWDMLSEGKGIEDIVSIMSEDYGEDPAVIREDVTAIIEKFKAMGLVTEE
jgi:hypothetical protein